MQTQKAEIPPIIRPVLTQIARMRAAGELDDANFQSQIDRVATTELQPRGFLLIVRELPSGQIRFLIKTESEGTVCDMIDCGS